MARVLVIDDEAGIRELVRDALAREGHRVAEAADGADGLAQLAATGFDVVVTDLRMPGLDGMAVLARVQAEQPDVPVIVLTAHGTIDSAVAAMRAGAFDYLTKPLSGPAELRLLVARAVEHRRLVARAEPTGPLPPLTWGAPAMTPVVEALRRVAGTATSVLLLGESGTGKELAARTLHAWSERRAAPFARVHCAAMSDTLLGSELLGHERGAFPGADDARRGALERAAGGTLFLDEIGELRDAVQATLARVIGERAYTRLGGARRHEADVRWIAATHADLAARRDQGVFRDDLYHRLAVFPITIPPLRARREDIAPLAATLLETIARELARPPLTLARPALARLEQAAWPGNVRELRNVLERAAILCDGDVLESAHLRLDPAPPPGAAARLPTTNLEELERLAVAQTLAEVGGNRKLAAEQLGIALRTMYEKLKKYPLE